MALEGRNVDIQVAEDELVVWMTEEVQLECLMMMMQLLLHIWILRSVDDYYYSWKWEYSTANVVVHSLFQQPQLQS